MIAAESPRGAAGELLAPLRRCRPLLALGWASLPLFPFACMLLLDYMNFSGDAGTILIFFQRHPGSAAFGYLTLLFLFTMALLLLRRVWPAALLLGALSLLCAYVNYTKTALNGDHFFPQDIGMASQAGELLSFLSGDVPR